MIDIELKSNNTILDQRTQAHNKKRYIAFINN